MLATKEQRDSRAKKTGEVFTPPKLANQMLDKPPDALWEPGKTFLDPACGNGNMLIHVLYRKLAIHEQDPTEALQSIYGCDIMRDNVRECRLRLLKMTSAMQELTEEDIAAVLQNVVWLNRKKFPNGSLDYDFLFKNKAKTEDIARWSQWIEDGALNSVTLPVTEEPGTGIFRDMFEQPAGDDEGYEA